MKKLAIAILLSAGVLASVEARASDGAVVGAVEGAIVGSHFGGAHGAVAGAIIGSVIGNSADANYDRRVRRGEIVSYEPVYQGGYQSYPQPVYQSAPVYYAPPVTYQTYYEPSPVVYVSTPSYGYGYGYPVRYASYASYRGPVYVGGRGYRETHRGGSYDHRNRY